MWGSNRKRCHQCGGQRLSLVCREPFIWACHGWTCLAVTQACPQLLSLFPRWRLKRENYLTLHKKLREGNFLLKDTSVLHIFKYSCPNDAQIYTCCLDCFWKHTFAYPAVHLYRDTNGHLRFNTTTDESGWLTLWQLHLPGAPLSQLILAYRSAFLFCCSFLI